MTSKRVLTYLKLGQELVLGQFGQCVVSSFNHDQDVHEVELCCDLAPQGLLLSPKTNQESSGVVLRHPPFCPMFHLTPDLRDKFDNPGISVAVAVILESLDTKVLITRRPPHMRTFPNVWVPPGGGSEQSETIIETGLREVKEETGIDVTNQMKFAEPLCLWESVYPPLLSLGDPKRHQMVVYLHVYVEQNAEDFQVQLDPQETNAFMWLTLEQIKQASDYSVPLDKQSKLCVNELKNGETIETLKSYDVLRAEVPSSGTFDVERISTGTRFALEQFYAKKSKCKL